MAQKVSDEENISLKALVDKGRNRVIFVEADNDFVDVLFSFLTLPMGKIVRLARDSSTPLEIGCMNKLYKSIEKLDVQVFRSNACRDMLLLPYSAANCHCKNLQLKIIDDAEPTWFKCRRCRYADDITWLSYYAGVSCLSCSSNMHTEVHISEGDSKVGGVFVKEGAGVIITDDLQVIPPLCAASISLFTKLGATNSNTTEELTFSIGVEQVLNLLVCSFVSKTPFTETLLKLNPVPKLGGVNFSQGKCIESQMSGASINEEKENVSVKLIVSKSKNVVCYAEVREDFVNLIFSFLTLPLGFILKQMLDSPWKGCIDQLCKGVLDFDEQFFKSIYHKELLCNPKLIPGFSYENNLLGIEEAEYYMFSDRKLTSDRSIIPSNQSSQAMTVEFLDPKSHGDTDTSARGFLKEPAIFMVTDNLDVRRVSPIFQLSVLNDLKVHFTDIEDRTVHVGKNEALRLLVASVVSDSVLTNAFLRKPQESSIKREQ
ncbi:hypothetical protein RchiOBHm_Chr5g0067841 [Rosa chinensis]|uniref:DUF674 family protein n=1 Tax=Rosa chinensis TaxID=74649 RepID=A0A2P6QJJ0_ROSCH|nr:uncharacterized protein LOC112165141 [Rosa chinensis]XP_024157344.1 uncharacterized protein LOC112165141 [Rosa chinensis]XP_040363098.1 uncharacterized protein LOC112165141 [Rosa chinensis]XP_040363099.1 uncharacterized protein LOC112165141 [Rosa chinensis]XP_040363100.1 uncharacterized protein LOC112165141 [Rosa chinensis]PRQ34351.1 hypothetical protein RchiOBHm_Chr5g0067841 [Rosa chinensis]